MAVLDWARMQPREPESQVDLAARRGCVKALLVDRDGLLIENVPYLDDPHLIRPVVGVRAALIAARTAGLLLGVVTNQSGIGRGVVREDDVARVNRSVDLELGPFDVWEVCPHAPGDGCVCRKPAPGLVLAAARRLGLDPAACAVVGDRSTDVEAANRAGALGVLVSSTDTTVEERHAVDVIFGTLGDAVDYLIKLGVDG